MKTAFYATYGLFDTTARGDSTPTTTSNQSFGNVLKLKDDIASADYGTLEEDYFFLDGSMPEMPDTPGDAAYFSTALSGADGTFSVNPVIHILFTEKHSSVGLTFHFVGAPPLQMRICWYDIDGNRMADEVFHVDSNKYLAWKQVENYTRITVEFLKARPYRYVKLRYIEYGTELICGAGGLPVKDASLIEECSPISDKIAVNKLSFKLIDEKDDFNVGNMSGLHKVLQNGQEAVAYEMVDGTPLLLGRFFLSGHKTDKNVTSISCVDFKGLLDNAKFREGRVYSGELAGTVIDQIMSAAGITDYTVDEKICRTPLYGWLKIQTCRKALREVLFACGAVIDSSRSMTLDIRQPDKKIKSAVERARKFSTSVENMDYISDVSVKFPVYTLDDETKQVAKGSYEAGIYTVDLSAPAADMTINTGKILAQSNNYVTFKLDAAADVVISGRKYSKEDLSVTASVDKVSAGQIRESKDFSCTVMDAAQAKKAAERILDYYSMQLGLKIRFLNGGEKPTVWAEVDNTRRIYGNYVAGFEKVTTDLTGGFISTAELRGYYKLVEDYYYTGELFAGEECGEL